MASEQPETQFQMELPPERQAGVPADFASVWHTPTTFVLDFVAVTQPPSTSVDETTGKPRVVVPGRVVSRVRIPPEQVFELARALTQQLDAWEKETGKQPLQDPIAPSPGA